MKLEVNKSMPGFNNYSTDKKEDVSTKLRAQDGMKQGNLRKTKEQTKKLEDESRKMEERLLELKLAMNREKEERERQGGGYWSRGQSGTLNSYATDVLNKPGPKQPKVQDGKKKVKVLKNSVLDLPERSSQPGTMAFIANQELSGTPRAHKVKATKCGQCEEKKAAVSCIQCSEVYCATCFTAFHLKGALKKHRSVPLSASGPRVCMSPRPVHTPTNRSIDVNDNSATPPTEPVDDRKVLRIRQSQQDRNGPEGASRSFEGPSLLCGEYNEEESAASFQQAVMEWRMGKSKQADDSANIDVERSTKVKVDPSPRVAYSPVKTPIVPIETGIGTEPQKMEIDIKFHSSMTYAERLLLKKHRRTEVDRLFTPRENDQNGKDSGDFFPRAITPHIHPPSLPPTPRNDPWIKEPSTPRVEQLFPSEKTMDSQEFKDNRVDFHALYEIATFNDPNLNISENEGDLAIEELDIENTKKMPVEETSACLVQEMDGADAYTTVKMSDGHRSRTNHSVSNSPSPGKKPPAGNTAVRNSPRSAKTRPIYDEQKENLEDHSVKSRPKSSAKSRPSTAKSRPPTAKSRPQTAKSRPASALKSHGGVSRPGSRSKSRAWSRMEGEGVLTKVPSQGLKDVAMLDVTNSNKPEMYSSAFKDFFTFGVKSEPVERVLTPSKHKQSENKVEKYKVSSMLYQMAPRSWRPDSSLADNVSEDVVQVDDAELPMETAEPLDINDQPSALLMAAPSPSNHDHVVEALGEKMTFDEGFQPSDSDIDPYQEDDIDIDDEDDLNELPASNIKTPRAGSVLARPDSGTPRPSSSVRHHSRPASGMSARSQMAVRRSENSSRRFMTPRPESRKQSFIVVDGEDLSNYDDVGKSEACDQEDEEALNNLEWELASQTGRLTADGKISKMSKLNDSDEFHSSDSEESMRSFSRMNQQDQGYDINSRLREDELDDNETDDEMDYADVEALH